MESLGSWVCPLYANIDDVLNYVITSGRDGAWKGITVCFLLGPVLESDGPLK